MSRKGRPEKDAPLPPLYAMVHGGLEPVAADEVNRELGAEVKKTTRGIVVFRLNALTPDILKLRTTEDIFLLAWGSDSLAYEASDLESIRKWTKKVDWPSFFKLHHTIRPKTKGRPTFNIICQMQGEHGYRRADARQAFMAGLEGAIPNGWQFSNENAWLEIWLTIHGKAAVCGVRLTDRTMRHRTYKMEHIAASLRPSVAGAMVRLAGIGPGMTVLDPMCGAGTILAEAAEIGGRRGRGAAVTVIGGDVDANAVFVATQNLAKMNAIRVYRWDAAALPLATASVDRIISNPPYGKQLSTPEEIGGLYEAAAREWNRVLKPGGRAVLLAMEQDTLNDAIRPYKWNPTRLLKVRLLGQPVILSVWQKPE
ncbi:MAG: methyltransferase domain-containing protein [Gemmataceae bacterium]